MRDGGFGVDATELREHSDELIFMPDARAADWAAIFARGEVLRFAGGERVVSAGEDERALYFLCEGFLLVELGPDLVKRIDAPSVVGELAFLDGGPRSAGLVAAGPAEVVRLDLEGFQRLSADDPELGRRMLLELGRVVAARLRALNEALEP